MNYISEEMQASQGYYKIGSEYTIRGKKYKPREYDRYTAVGVASWYGGNDHNKLTANGELFNKYEFSAAHKTLPLPSLVRVTNLENNSSMVLKVNDRGPFADERIIDLSESAAKVLGFYEKGIALVKVEYLKKESQKLEERIKAKKQQPSIVYTSYDIPVTSELSPKKASTSPHKTKAQPKLVSNKVSSKKGTQGLARQSSNKNSSPKIAPPLNRKKLQSTYDSAKLIPISNMVEHIPKNKPTITSPLDIEKSSVVDGKAKQLLTTNEKVQQKNIKNIANQSNKLNSAVRVTKPTLKTYAPKNVQPSPQQKLANDFNEGLKSISSKIKNNTIQEQLQSNLQQKLASDFNKGLKSISSKTKNNTIQKQLQPNSQQKLASDFNKGLKSVSSKTKNNTIQEHVIPKSQTTSSTKKSPGKQFNLKSQNSKLMQSSRIDNKN